MEDFVPHGDWGEIKYYFKKRIYKISYGSELCWSYDFLTNFELITKSFDDEFQEATGMPPLIYLEQMLNLSDYFIEELNLESQPDQRHIPTGYLECPPELCFNKCSDFLHDIDISFLSKKFKKDFTIQIGELDKTIRDENNFTEACISGDFSNFLFIKTDEELVPITARWFIPSFINKMGMRINENKGNLKMEKPPLPIRIGGEVGNYVRSRLKSDRVFILASATELYKKPADFIFPFTIQAKDSIYLFCFLSPFLDKKTIEKSFQNVHKGIEEAKKIFEKEVALALHLQKQCVAFGHDHKKTLNPKFIVIVPHFTTGWGTFPIPKNLDAEVIFLEQFLGIIEELQDADTFDDYFEYKENLKGKMPLVLSELDNFASFKQSHKVLIGGAIEPQFIMLDPNSGTDLRFDTLREFWENYPEQNYMGNPTTWKLSKDSETRVRLTSKSHQRFAISCKIGNATIFLSSPFEFIEYQPAAYSNLLAECLEDYLSQISIMLNEYPLFQYNRTVLINIFPKCLVHENPSKFSHLKELAHDASPYSIDSGKIAPYEYMFRIIFDEEKIPKELSVNEDSSGEIKIIELFIDRIESEFKKEKNSDEIRNYLNEKKKNKPGYTITAEQKRASFPDFISSSQPEPKHFKLAKKFIAQTAKENNFEPGTYDLQGAKEKVDVILNLIEKEINSRVNEFRLEQAIPILLEKTDALTHEDERKSMDVSSATKREIRYDLPETMTKQHKDYTTMYKNYSFLIEKFVQTSPQGTKIFDEEEFKHLAALVDWYFSFVNVGDQIYHNLFPVGVEVDDEFRIDVKSDISHEDDDSNFIKYMMSRRAKINIRSDDNVNSGRSIHTYMDEANEAFKSGLGFSFIDLISVTHVLSSWGYRDETDDGEQTNYSESIENIVYVCSSCVDGIDKDTIPAIIDFLILKKENVCKVIGKKDYPEIPVWEMFKRHSRYNVRPLILIDKKICWGPYSLMKTGIIWSGSVQDGRLPVDLELEEITACLSNEKALVEKELENKTFSIINRFTNFAELNVYLHKRGKKEGYPEELGDYDVLAFFDTQNILVSIESKHINSVFCLKDTRDQKEELFGRNKLNGSYVGKVCKRHNFLEENWQKVAKTMKWDITQKPQVVSLFCSKNPYYWTFCPPIEVPIVFKVVDELHSYIEELISLGD
ncbi:hypothetical protein KAS08_06245 [Candidatus Pacearchaeota archaeon]|nr:hypothetical protein [Candidatus Pacearchaeota archaeon]